MRILTVVGTRPEAIKLAPLVTEARRRALEVVVCATAQHREMLDQVLALFDIRPEHDLDLMRPDQSLADLTARAIRDLDAVVTREAPDWIVVQGDTTTAMVGALVGFYRRVPVGHVEAGLRTGDLRRPFPEELNRRVADLVADAHFAPTARAARSLLAEGVPESSVHVTGNTVVDALHAIRARSGGEPAPGSPAALAAAAGERLLLVTAHRRESFGAGMQGIARAVDRIARRHADVRVVYPVHPNPNVRATMREVLGATPRVHLVDPLPYHEFVGLLARAHLVVSDSGGVQEEAPSLGVPALVLREVTERPEAVEAGAVRLVGVDEEAIVAAVEAVLGDPETWRRMSRPTNPYGDGHASERIVSILRGEPWEPFSPGTSGPAGA